MFKSILTNLYEALNGTMLSFIHSVDYKDIYLAHSLLCTLFFFAIFQIDFPKTNHLHITKKGCGKLLLKGIVMVH